MTRVRWWALVTVVLVLAGVGGVVAGMALSGGDSSGGGSSDVAMRDGAVQLEPVTHRSSAPFAESVVTLSDDELLAGVAAPAADLRGNVAGSTNQLYATRRARPVCDVADLADQLTADERTNETWAGVAGVDPAEVRSVVVSMTPVVLTTDTAVTNHTYGSDGATAYSSVLQAGTPVLVDDHGVPRVQCSCGNPLLPPGDSDSDTFEGDPWESFDPDTVVRIDPTEDRVDQLETIEFDGGGPVDLPAGRNAELDGLLVSDDDGVHVLDEASGDRTTVIDRPVRAVFDDGAGGLVYTLRDPSRPTTSWVEGPPADPDYAPVWHLAAGSTDAVELIGTDGDPRQWVELLGVGALGGTPKVVFVPLVNDPDEAPSPDVEVPTGDVTMLDLATDERVTLLEYGFGWEQGTGSVSFGGGLVAMEAGYAEPDWWVFDAEANRRTGACSWDEDTEPLLDLCPWDGVLDDDGDLVHLGSAAGSFGGDGSTDTVRVLDLSDGTVRSELPIDVHTTTVDERFSRAVDVHDGRLAVQVFHLEGAVQGTAIVDLSDGSATEHDAAVRFLSAPLIRPTTATPTDADDSGDGSDDTASTRSGEHLDPMNMLLPGAVCSGFLGDEAAPVRIEGGDGATTTDHMSEDYVHAMIRPEATALVDIDGDGASELVVSPVCNWGGSGYSTPVAVLTAEPGGDPQVVGEVLDVYGRSDRDVTTIDVDDDATIVISGGEWSGSDPMCCASGDFTARWRFSEGSWSEIDP